MSCILQAETISSITANAAIGGLATVAFTAINPLAGVIFGTLAGITYSIIGDCTKGFFNDSTWLKTAKVFFNFLAALIIGVVATSLLGFTLTIEAGLILTLSMVATTIAITSIFRLCFQMKMGHTCCESFPQLEPT